MDTFLAKPPETTDMVGPAFAKYLPDNNYRKAE